MIESMVILLIFVICLCLLASVLFPIFVLILIFLAALFGSSEDESDE